MQKVLRVFNVIVLVIIFSNGVFAKDTSKKNKIMYFGYGIGSGNGSYTINNKHKTFKSFFQESNVADPSKYGKSMGIGIIVNPALKIGLDFSSIDLSSGVTLSETKLDVNNYFIVASVRPFDERLSIKAGFGFSYFNIETVIGDDTNTNKYFGYGMSAGLGYSLWDGDFFKVDLNVEYSRQRYFEESGLQDSHFWIAFASCYLHL